LIQAPPVTGKKKTRSGLGLLALFLLGAALLWIFRDEISSRLGWNEKRKNPAQEKISEQERKKLDDILKKR
jgi:hypothetical protein